MLSRGDAVEEEGRSSFFRRVLVWWLRRVGQLIVTVPYGRLVWTGLVPMVFVGLVAVCVSCCVVLVALSAHGASGREGSFRFPRTVMGCRTMMRRVARCTPALFGFMNGEDEDGRLRRDQ
jgi:hypothetical protein